MSKVIWIKTIACMFFLTTTDRSISSVCPRHGYHDHFKY